MDVLQQALHWIAEGIAEKKKFKFFRLWHGQKAQSEDVYREGARDAKG
jgi:hypothetical protein